MDHVRIFDTTLRDGEQSPGATLNADEKLEIARQLARLGVDIIEAGFPVASPDDFAAVRRIAEQVEGPVICGLARAVEVDVDRAWEAVRPSARPRIHVFMSTSDIHLQHQFRKSRQQALEPTRAMVARARGYTDDVEFSPMDATRTAHDYLFAVLEAAVEEGATTLNIPDTVGFATPEEYGALIAAIRANVRGAEKTVISVHCHDDLGLAVANSLAGIVSGARQVEVAVNGIGERAGNCSLEEIAMIVHTRAEALGVRHQLAIKEITRTSRLISMTTGYSVQPNKAVVGASAFAHESGIHQHGVLANRATARFKDLADRKIQLTDQDLQAIVSEELGAAEGDELVLESVVVGGGTHLQPRATVHLKRGDQTVEESAIGDGLIDAVIGAIQRAAGVEGRLVTFNVSSVTGGSDALGDVVVQLDIDGRRVTGRGVATDVVEASARAYLAAINRALAAAAAESPPTEPAAEVTP